MICSMGIWYKIYYMVYDILCGYMLYELHPKCKYNFTVSDLVTKPPVALLLSPVVCQKQLRFIVE